MVNIFFCDGCGEIGYATDLDPKWNVYCRNCDSYAHRNNVDPPTEADETRVRRNIRPVMQSNTLVFKKLDTVTLGYTTEFTTYDNTNTGLSVEQFEQQVRELQDAAEDWTTAADRAFDEIYR